MWSQLLYIILLITCPLGQAKDHIIHEKQIQNTLLSDEVVERADVVFDSWELGGRVYHSHHLWMSLTGSCQFDIPGDYGACGNVAYRTLSATKRFLPYNIDLSIHSSQYLRHLSSYYDSGIYILMRKLVI